MIFLIAIFNYINHPSIIAIKNLTNTSIFSFPKISVDDAIKEIRKLNPRKAT